MIPYGDIIHPGTVSTPIPLRCGGTHETRFRPYSSLLTKPGQMSPLILEIVGRVINRSNGRSIISIELNLARWKTLERFLTIYSFRIFFSSFFFSFPHLCGKNRITTANIEKGEKLFYIKRRGIAVESSSLFRESNLTWRDHEEGGGGEECIYYSTLLVTPLLVHFLVRERCTGAMYNYRG